MFFLLRKRTWQKLDVQKKAPPFIICLCRYQLAETRWEGGGGVVGAYFYSESESAVTLCTRVDNLMLCFNKPEPVFVNLVRSPGIDSQPGGIDFLESIPGLLKRLQIRALPF
jgi:hypothetical protein